MTEPFNGPTRADVGTLGNRLAIKEPFKITFITDKKNKKKNGATLGCNVDCSNNNKKLLFAN